MVIAMELKQYDELRKEFLKVAKFHLTPSALRELKIHYEKAINSVRASDSIDSIEDLVRILEKRGVIRYNQIVPLRHIAKTFLSNSVINGKLADYESWLKGYEFPYSPQTNLYRCKTGECYLKNRNMNNLSISNNNSDLNTKYSFANYKFPGVTTEVFIIDDDFSDSNNSKVSISSFGTEISFKNNFNCNSKHDKPHKTCQDFEIHVTRKIYNVCRNEKNKLVSEVQMPITLNSSRELCPSLHSTLEDSHNNDPLSDKPFVTTPQSLEPQTVCSSFIDTVSHHSLKEFSSKEKSSNKRDRLKRLSKNKYVRISVTILPIAVIIVTLLIVYNLSTNSVQYNPKPTAPSDQEDFCGSASTSTKPYLVYSETPIDHSYNAVLQKLPMKERQLLARVFQEVSRKLGKSWRDVARYLLLTENDINDIEGRYTDCCSKALESLKIFAVESDISRWKLHLKNALSSSRRSDIVKNVEEIISRPEYN